MKLSHFKKDQKTRELSSLRDKITKTASFEIHERMTFNHHVMNICFAVSDGFPFSPTTHIGRSSAKDLCQPRPHPSRSHRLVPNLPKVEETTNLTAMWNPGEMKRKTLQHSRCSVVLCLLNTVGLYLVFTVKFVKDIYEHLSNTATFGALKQCVYRFRTVFYYLQQEI